MECKLNDPGDAGCEQLAHSFVFTPGNVYAGNLCAAEHVVIHESDHDRSEGFEAHGQELKLTAMLRTSLFPNGSGRILPKPPVPKIGYKIANTVVAKHLLKFTLAANSWR